MIEIRIKWWTNDIDNDNDSRWLIGKFDKQFTKSSNGVLFDCSAANNCNRLLKTIDQWIKSNKNINSFEWEPGRVMSQTRTARNVYFLLSLLFLSFSSGHSIDRLYFCECEAQVKRYPLKPFFDMVSPLAEIFLNYWWTGSNIVEDESRHFERDKIWFCRRQKTIRL